MIERRYTGDNEIHNLLDRPRDRPKRTAAGVAMFALLFTLFAASSTDVLANFFKVSLNATLWFFRIAVIVVPDHRGTGHVPALQGDAGRARDRQAQAGRHRAPLGRGRVLHGARGAASRRRAHRARSRAGADAHRHRAAVQRRRPRARELAHRRAPGHALSGTGRPDRVTARDLWVAAETVHAVTYFAPGCRDALRDAGLRGFWSGYFAARAAPLGRVGAGPVTAAFFNFHPAMVAKAVPGCWDVVAPETLCRVRAIAAADALSEVCSTHARSALVAALPLLRRAVAAADGAGRMLAGANRTLWPRIAPALGTGGVGEAWQAATTLREHRGDGHVAALVSRGLRGVEAHLLAAGTKGIPAEVLRDSRGFSVEDWDIAAAGLGGAWPPARRRAGHRRRADPARRGGGPHRPPRRARLRRPERRRAGRPARRPARVRRRGGRVGVLPYPNPIGTAAGTALPPGLSGPGRDGVLGVRVAQAAARGGGQPGTSPSSLHKRARRDHLSRVAPRVGIVTEPGGDLAGHLGRRRDVAGVDQDLVGARGPHGLGEGEAGRDGEGPDALRTRTRRGTCR